MKIKVELPSKHVVEMISTYEFLKWNNKGSKEEVKFCSDVIKALKKSLVDNNITVE